MMDMGKIDVAKIEAARRGRRSWPTDNSRLVYTKCAPMAVKPPGVFRDRYRGNIFQAVMPLSLAAAGATRKDPTAFFKAASRCSGLKATLFGADELDRVDADEAEKRRADGFP